MVELRTIEDTVMQQSFAGDVYNSAVYLKRAFPNIGSGVITAVGQDSLSAKMLEQFTTESLETQFVFKHNEKVTGMYLIETDEVGERHFTYWRNDSAARQTMQFIDESVIAELAKANSVFFSGISLAVIPNDQRPLFWSCIESLKRNGVTIIFDPNYRARLWSSPQEAQAAFEQAFRMADIALPGVEDLQLLYGIDSTEGVLEFCQPFNLRELVVKNGPHSVLTIAEGELQHHTITPVDNIVDTTSAGDAFNGVYLGARMQEKSVSESVHMAAWAAGTVIQHPGAIIPKEAFEAAMSRVGL